MLERDNLGGAGVCRFGNGASVKKTALCLENLEHLVKLVP